MDLHQLRHFVALAEHGSFTRAAEASFITQSAFSRSIQGLEHHLGCVLVERGAGGRGISLTARGQAMHQRARAIIEGVSSLREDIVGLDQAPLPTLAFGCGPLPASRLVPVALGRFLDRHRDTSVDLKVAPPDELKQLLDNGEIEFVVADLRHIETNKGYVSQVLRPRRFQVFCRVGHPLLAKPVAFARLAEHPMGCTALPAELRVLLAERAGRRALPVNVECRHNDVLVQMVTTSDLVGIAPEDVVGDLVRRGEVAALVFSDAPEGLAIGGTCFGVVYRAGHSLSARAQAMIAEIGEVDAGPQLK